MAMAAAALSSDEDMNPDSAAESENDFSSGDESDEGDTLARIQRRLRRDGIGDDDSGDDDIVDDDENSEHSDSGSSSEDDMDVDWLPNFSEDRRRNVEFTPSRPVGPQQVLGPEKKAIDFWRLFVSDDTLHEIIHQTDSNALRKRAEDPEHNKGKWTRPSLAEFLKFLGLFMLMGVIRKPDSKSYWSAHPLLQTPIFAAIMVRDRFLQILRYLSIQTFCLNGNLPRQHPDYDATWRLSWFLNAINTKFRQLLQPDKSISVDECMVPFKGRSPFRQYMKNKPKKWGVKLWAIADKNGYVQSLSIYSGKRDNPEQGLAKQVVESLLTRARLAGQGYHLYMDNFFTSVPLFRSLLDRRTLACGTVQRGRRGLPASVMSKKPADLGAARGSLVTRQQGPLLALAWRDKKIVYALSSIHNEEKGVVSRTVKVNGQFARRNFECPIAVRDYTAYMGGVDHADQMAQYYLPQRRSVKWNLKVFFYLLEVVKVNASILFRSSPNHQPERRNSPYSLLEFTLMLCEQLIGEPLPEGITRRGRPSLEAPEARLTSRCMPMAFPTISWCHVCYKRVKKGRQEKRRQTRSGCADCGKHLCLPDCFTAYHTKTKYWE